MERLRLGAAPVFFAYRRLRRRPGTFAAIVVALGGAVALIGWSSLTAADAQERNVRARLAELPPRQRSLQVIYFMLPDEADFRAKSVSEALHEFRDVSAVPRRVRISHSIEPNRPLGTRLVVVDDPNTDVVVRRGRLPVGCCEALRLAGGRVDVGHAAQLAPGVRVRVVGVGTLRRGLLSSPSDLGTTALLVPSFAGALRPLVAAHGSTIVMTAPLAPRRVHAFALDDLRGRLRTAMARLSLGDPLVRPTAPLGVLAEVEHRGDVARNRLLLVAGEGAALILAFTAFVATARRREAELVDGQLTDLGAARGQRVVARIAELLAPGIVGAALAVGGVALAALVVAGDRGLPSGFVGAALPLQTVLVMLAVGAAGTLLLFGSLAPRRSPRLGVGALELAALTALGLIVWQTAVTGALDPGAVARGGAPLILLVPALAFFAAGILLLRVVPPALRLGQRFARRKPLVRLAIVTAARNPAQAAAATTFLAVALGSSLFSLEYLTTIDRQARDQARFTVGAVARVAGGGPGRPALRLGGAVNATDPPGAQLAVRVLALPTDALRRVSGWRDDFSPLSRQELARRLRPAPIRLTGPPLARDATEVRAWARSETDYPRTIVLHFLLDDQRFAQLELGTVFHRWKLLRAPVRGLGGAQLVGVQYEPTFTPISFKYDPEGYVDLGPIEERRADGWTALPAIGGWSPTTSPDGRAGILYSRSFGAAPIAAGTRFELNGTFQPLVHPPAGLPPPLSGFQTGPIPAVAGPPVADQAVDDLVTLVVAGKALPARIVGRARFFPTITTRPHDFVVLDYDTLFAALNSDWPGIAEPTERWSFGGRPPASALLSVPRVEAGLRNDPLAAGTHTVLEVSGVVAALLAFIGLVLATRSAVTSERLVLAEYEALGVSPRSLRRTAQLRLLVLSAVGIAAGVAGGFAAVRLVGAFVAVTGAARRPLPPIVAVVDWTAAAVVVAVLVAAALAAAALIAGRALREPAARRLRA